VSTAADIIKSALLRINSYSPGEPLLQPDADGCLHVLNDLLESWSIDKQLIYGSVENILTLQSGKAQYTVGNPTNTSLGEPPFVGTVTSGSPTITGVTSIPSDLKAGGILTDLAGAIPAGTLVTAVGTNTVTMSANATVTPSTNPEPINYTIPGDFAIPRPNRITHAFTRFSQLDFSIQVLTTESEFTAILYKAQPGPWPTVAWYNPQMPYGLLNFYQTPGNNGELHLFTDTILADLTINQTFVLPAGYARALKWALAKEICAEYGYPMTPAILTHADEAMKMIKALNALPAEKARYDRMLRGSRANAGWIMNGGYR
jgi:hypothetical protein